MWFVSLLKSKSTACPTTGMQWHESPALEGSLGKVIDCVTFSRLLGFWTFCSIHH